LLAGDDARALSERVLASEHQIYPTAVRWVVEGALRVEGGLVLHRAGHPQLLALL
jgi:phosphoribosylglycinamide formyltransferase-1